jgi:purine-binding chemotaxis protein CheW
MQGASAAADSDNRVTLGCFQVGGSVYALDVAQLREVVRWRPVTPLPMAPKLIEGVIDLRGALVPVIDLARALGCGAVETGARARIAVTEIDGMVVGLAVDAAIEMLSVDAAMLEDPPALAIQAGYGASRAVVRRPDAEPVMVLSLEHLLESVYRSALRAQEIPE